MAPARPVTHMKGNLNQIILSVKKHRVDKMKFSRKLEHVNSAKQVPKSKININAEQINASRTRKLMSRVHVKFVQNTQKEALMENNALLIAVHLFRS